jgi:predicted DNA-binding transcriptional regulator AlpA
MDLDVLTKEDLAQMLGCSLSTIHRRMQSGVLPPQMPRIDRKPRWYRPVVLEWMAHGPARGFAKTRRYA